MNDSTTQVYAATIRVEISTQSDHYGSKQVDQLLDFGRAIGDVYIVSEGFADATEDD